MKPMSRPLPMSRLAERQKTGYVVVQHAERALAEFVFVGAFSK